MLAYWPTPQSMWSDDDLLRAWRAGNRTAGDALVRRHYESVRRFFDLRLPAMAEDLTQLSFLACVEGRERVRLDAGFRPYLFGVARRLLFRQLRSQDRFDRMARFRTSQGPDTKLTPSGVVALRQEHKLLLRAFEAIPTDAQIALQLHYWEGMNTNEIGAVLGLSITAVTSRLSRARQRLRDEVEAIRVRPEVRASLLGDLDGWTRSLVPGAKPIA